MITKKQMSEQQALSRLASACSQAEHCTGEINQKLERWGIAPDAHQRILDYLITNKYVDDARFAKLFVRDKLKFNKWGRRKIAEALWMKRIPTDIQEEALAEITDEDYINDSLIPEFKSRLQDISIRLTESIRTSLQNGVTELIEQKRASLNQLKTEQKEKKELFDERMNQLREYKTQLLTL